MGWDGAILVNVESIWSIHGMDARTGGIQAVVVQPRSVADAYRLRARFRTGGTVAVFPAEVLIELYELLGDVGALIRFLSMCYQIVAIAGAALGLACIFYSRQRQFELLRMLGASQSYLVLVTCLEAGSVIAVGVIAGCALGWVGAIGLGHVLGAKLGIDVVPAFAAENFDVLVPVIVAGMAAAAISTAAVYLRIPGARLRGG